MTKSAVTRLFAAIAVMSAGAACTAPSPADQAADPNAHGWVDKVFVSSIGEHGAGLISNADRGVYP